jgi:protein involved in ribonucleotide reduction
MFKNREFLHKAINSEKENFGENYGVAGENPQNSFLQNHEGPPCSA